MRLLENRGTRKRVFAHAVFPNPIENYIEKIGIIRCAVIDTPIYFEIKFCGFETFLCPVLI